MVLNRVASNFVQARTRPTRDGAKNENEDSSTKPTTRDLKSVRMQSATMAFTRERRAQLSGGVKGKQQRAKESKKRQGHTNRTHTQPARTSVEASSSSTSLPHSIHEQQRNEVHADIEMASMDTRGQEPEPPSYSVLQLDRVLRKPNFKEVTEAQLEAVDSSIASVPASYARDALEVVGEG